jgi:hypothetical protein
MNRWVQTTNMPEKSCELGFCVPYLLALKGLRVLEHTMAPRSEPTGNPTTLLEVNSRGVAKLADGTFWRLALDGGRAANWIGAQVIVTKANNPNPVWGLALVNLDEDDHVAVVATGARF